jgi:hypothetical protein
MLLDFERVTVITRKQHRGVGIESESTSENRTKLKVGTGVCLIVLIVGVVVLCWNERRPLTSLGNEKQGFTCGTPQQNGRLVSQFRLRACGPMALLLDESLMEDFRLGPSKVSTARKMGRDDLERQMEFVGMATPTPRGRKTGKRPAKGKSPVTCEQTRFDAFFTGHTGNQ